MESRIPQTLDEEVAALSRGADRDSLFMQAELILPGRTKAATVRVRNLSAGGMLAEAPLRIAQGTTVEVELRNIGAVPGHIVWVGDGKFGIAFEYQVNPQAVRRQIVRTSEVPAHISVLNRGPFHRRR